MKKYIILAACLIACPVSVFAYGYDSYSSSDSNVYTIIMLIFGILNIILFCKIWGMTSNISRIYELMVDLMPAPKFKVGQHVYCEPWEHNVEILKDYGDDTYLCKSIELSDSETVEIKRYPATAFHKFVKIEEIPIDEEEKNAYLKEQK